MKVSYKQEELNGQTIWRVYVGETPLQAHALSEHDAVAFCQGFVHGAQWFISEMPERPYF